MSLEKLQHICFPYLLFRKRIRWALQVEWIVLKPNSIHFKEWKHFLFSMILYAFDTGTFTCVRYKEFYLWKHIRNCFPSQFNLATEIQFQRYSMNIALYVDTHVSAAAAAEWSSIWRQSLQSFFQLNSHRKVHSDNIPNCCFIDNGHRNKTFRIVVGYKSKIKVTLSYTGTKLQKFYKHIYSHLHSHSEHFDILRIVFCLVSMDKSFIMKHIFRSAH